MNRLLLGLVMLAAVVVADHNCLTEWNYCQNGGTCHDPAIGGSPWSDPRCLCKPGFGGADCSYTTKECNWGDSPCANGGTCVDFGSCNTNGGTNQDGSCFTCNCPPGFGGPECREPNACGTFGCTGFGTQSCSLQWNVPQLAHCNCKPAPNSTYFFAQPKCEFAFQFDCTKAEFACANGGTCQGGGSSCSCPPAFEGLQCTETNWCQTNVCANGGTCNPGTGFPGGSCSCPPLYTGKHCELIPFCQPGICLNGGTCNVGTAASGSCSCVPGYWGKYCENAYTAEGCATMQPCSHGGTCDCTYVDQTGGAAAGNCLNPTSGQKWDTICNCQGKWGDCRCNSTVTQHCPSQPADNPCQHGGFCINHQNGYYCSCTNGYYGEHCENYDNICATRSPCENGGRCSVSYQYSSGDSRTNTGYGFWECDCHYPYYGERCEMRADVETICQTGTVNPCTRGNCTVRGYDRGFFYNNPGAQNQRVQLPPYQCICANETWGLQCENNGLQPWDTCQNSPGKCLNGGTCWDNGQNGASAKASCACRCGWAGDRCEVAAAQVVNNVNNFAAGGQLLTFCHNNPCQNGATCIESYTGQGFVCNCQAGWWGTTCEKAGRSGAAAIAPTVAVALLAAAVAFATRRF